MEDVYIQRQSMTWYNHRLLFVISHYDYCIFIYKIRQDALAAYGKKNNIIVKNGK